MFWGKVISRWHWWHDDGTPACGYVGRYGVPRYQFSHAESRRSERPDANYCPVCAEMWRDSSLSALDAVRIVQRARVP